MLLIHLPAFIALTALGASASASCLHGTSLQPRRLIKYEGELETVEVSKFGYTGLQGPLNWAGLSEENAACKESNNQSPINLASPQIEQVAPGAMKISIPKVEAAELENLGSTVEVVMEGLNGTLAFEGKTFALKQFHFHTPSEHRINEEHFPLEMHSTCPFTPLSKSNC
jgi:carbonic anhydrase